ncbi:MAG: glycoside hydrolase family 78 protein [Clostridia bacterium]|nr:glycoside hydrolase family 78 protein [Clostridia bacterium]
MIAKWICAGQDIGSVSPDFTKEIKLAGKVKSATLCVSARGLYCAYIDGKRVGKQVLTPGWTSYDVRIQYQTYDVTGMLTENSSVISILAGKGWACGNLAWRKNSHLYGDFPAVIAWLDITYVNGEKEHIKTDETWSVSTSEILDSEIYHGEIVDKTVSAKNVGHASLIDINAKLIGQVGVDIIEHERVAAVRAFTAPNGERIVDFGQNMTGYVEIRVKGERGTRIVIDHAEVVDKAGNFCCGNMRSARNENTYVLSGGDDVFKPRFTFQGFRYIRLKEFPFDTVDKDMFTAVAVYSDIRRTGYFACGNEKINQLYHNVLWGQRSNYLDIPTDCPQRDERLGWTGDAQVFCATAARNFDVRQFFGKWLGDMAIEQAKRGDGGVPNVIPDVLRNGAVSSAWGDAACVIPWEIYLAYGDRKMLTEEYPMMKKWIDYIRHRGREEYLWIDDWHYGDWLAMDVEGDGNCSGATQRDLIASVYYARGVANVIKAGKALNEDVTEYETLYAEIKKKFHENFMENGLPCMSKIVSLRSAKNLEEQKKIDAISQTGIALILTFGLYDGEAEKKKLVDKLCSMIHDNGDRMTVGFVGAPIILSALSEGGRPDVAYTLLFQEKMPSWLYAVNHGATTMWERWNCIKEDGSFSSFEMTSFNHYAYGAVADWLYGTAAGIRLLDDGAAYTHISLAPIPDRRLGFVNCKIETARGAVVSKWYYSGDGIHYEFTVPDGTTAEMKLPDGTEKTLTAGEYLYVTAV